jgi:membrane protein
MLGDRLLQMLRRHRAGRALVLLIDNLGDHYATIAASAIAFDAFLSLVPLVALAGMVLHLLHENGELLLGPILSASPAPVRAIVEGTVNSTAVLAPVSVGAFIWTSSAGISTAMSVFENMFHSPPRPWWWRRGIAMIWVVAAVIVIAAVTGITIGVGLLSRSVGAVVAVVVPPATLIGMLSSFFRIAVRVGPVFTRRRVLPGVLVTLVLWTILTAAFSLYLFTALSRYATLYGGLAGVAIFLFWLWLLALALLTGGEVNAQLDGVRDDPPVTSTKEKT